MAATYVPMYLRTQLGRRSILMPTRYDMTVETCRNVHFFITAFCPHPHPHQYEHNCKVRAPALAIHCVKHGGGARCQHEGCGKSALGAHWWQSKKQKGQAYGRVH